MENAADGGPECARRAARYGPRFSLSPTDPPYNYFYDRFLKYFFIQKPLLRALLKTGHFLPGSALSESEIYKFSYRLYFLIQEFGKNAQPD